MEKFPNFEKVSDFLLPNVEDAPRECSGVAGRLTQLA